MQHVLARYLLDQLAAFIVVASGQMLAALFTDGTGNPIDDRIEVLATGASSGLVPVEVKLTEAVTAPHLVCPMTTISLEPATPHAYSRLPSTLGPTTLPAMRMLKTSPRPRSSMVSTGARESIQLRIAANGN